MLLSRHARRMMIDGRLRALGRFTKALSFPLSLWLAKERYGSALRATDGWPLLTNTLGCSYHISPVR